MLKKKFKKLIKKVSSSFFFLIYPKIKIKDNLYSIKKFYKINLIKLNNINYKIFKIKDGRVFTNAVDDAAYIFKNFLLTEPSYQYRNSVNSHIKNNITLKIGTPSLIKDIKS